MAKLAVKPGVQPPILYMAAVLANIGQEFPQVPEIVITAGMDGQHRPHSLHYALRALDVRTKNLNDAEVDRLVLRLREELGDDYDVILEAPGTVNQHIHLELDL